MNKDVVILIPVYNPNENIMLDFLKKLEKEYSNIVFINDGCSEKHKEFFDKLSLKYPVIKHNINLGKGRGLKNGFNYILNNYENCKTIVTADCDGQHSVYDIKKVAKVSLKSPNSMVLGVRDFDKKNVPLKSKFGNKITRNFLYSIIGIKISDTQTGLRAISPSIAKKILEIPGERYEYETNILISAKKLDIKIIEVGIETIYLNNNETSHFNPIKDSFRIYRLFTKYILILFLAFIIENIFFTKYSGVFNIAYTLLFCKAISGAIIALLNKHLNLKYLIINYFIILSILYLIPNHLLIWKIVFDLILFLVSLLVINFKTKIISN